MLWQRRSMKWIHDNWNMFESKGEFYKNVTVLIDLHSLFRNRSSVFVSQYVSSVYLVCCIRITEYHAFVYFAMFSNHIDFNLDFNCSFNMIQF